MPLTAAQKARRGAYDAVSYDNEGLPRYLLHKYESVSSGKIHHDLKLQSTEEPEDSESSEISDASAGAKTIDSGTVRIYPKRDSVIWRVSTCRPNRGGQVYIGITPKNNAVTGIDSTTYTGASVSQFYERPQMPKGTNGPKSSHECRTDLKSDLSAVSSAISNGLTFLSCSKGNASLFKDLAVESRQPVFQGQGSIFFRDDQTSNGWIGLTPVD